jgi:D-alanyl-D-alanine dipeptidase
LGYTLVIWDAYRPKEAQFKLWDVCPDGRYVANPHTGFSSHSRGNTIDITIQRFDGTPVKMPTKFDEFSSFADRDYSDIPQIARENALLLETLMKKHGFNPYAAEWWHYSDTTYYDVI